MPAVIDLAALVPAQGFTLQGDAPGDQFGFKVSNVGDINGDGVDDVIIGAPGGDDGGIYAGEAYVIYGKPGSTRTLLDVTNLSASDGFVIQGGAQGSRIGRHMSNAGDVNGDGIDDLVVGESYGFVGAYVIYGQTGTTRTRIGLASLSASDGFTILANSISNPVNDFVGLSVSGAGDVNGDLIDDLVVGARSGDTGGNDAGEAYVIYGRAGATRGTQMLENLATSDGFAIQGDTARDEAGRSVSGAGDVNGDGIDDLIIGAPRGDDGNENAGEAYVIYGQSGTSRGRIDLTGLAAADGFIIQGDQSGDNAGYSVSSAGDVNGDGIEDVIVGADFGDNGARDAGEAYVIYGRSGITRGTVDLTGLSAADGFIIVSPTGNSSTGYSVSGAGDVNGDGFDDVIVGSPFGDLGANDAGEAYVIFGRNGSTRTTIDLGNLAEADGFIIQGDSNSDNVGIGVSGAGDVNGDGADDLIVGARTGDTAGADPGRAYVVYGGRSITNGGDEGGGNDVLLNGPGDEAFDGGAGFDQIDMAGLTVPVTLNTVTNMISSSATGTDTVINVEFFTLGSGNDVVTLGNSGFVVRAGLGNDTVTGGTGRDLISGGSGNDTLSGGTGTPNELGGGAGDDIYIVAATGDTVIELAGEGVDEIQTPLSVMVNRQNVETLRFTGTAANTGVGDSHNETIIGSIGADELIGRGGDDVLRGGTGAANALIGGTGDDTYFVDAIGDSVIEAVGEGIDRVVTSLATLVLRDQIENLSFTGAADATGVGNASANAMTGGAGNDFLSGLDGDDVLTGGLGLDLLIGGAGADTFRINNVANPDRIFDFMSGTDKIALDSAAFTRMGRIGYVAGTAAASSNSTFLYNSDNGVLSYDADGTGAGAPVAIANLGGGLSLSVGDFTFY